MCTSRPQPYEFVDMIVEVVATLRPKGTHAGRMRSADNDGFQTMNTKEVFA